MKFWKKLLAAQLSVAMLTGAAAVAPVAVPAAAAETEDTVPTSGTTGDCTWTLDVSTGKLTIAGNGRMADCTAAWNNPWYLASQNVRQVTSLEVCEGVTYIGNSAFYGLTAMTEATLPESLESIGSSAFQRLAALETIRFPSRLREINSYAFSGTGLKELTLPTSLVTLNAGAFSECSRLEKLTIPDGCTACLRTNAFGNCGALARVSIGSGITDMQEGAFKGSFVTAFSVSAGNPALSTVYGNLYSKDKTKLYHYAAGKSNTVFTVPATVTEIGEGAFYRDAHLKTVKLPDSLTRIGKQAFEYSQVENLNFPDTLCRIDEGALLVTPWYTAQPSGMVYAGKVACGCKGAVPETLSFKNDTIGIAGGAFKRAQNLTYVAFPSNLQYIGNEAFCQCTALQKSLSSPAGAVSLGSSAFYGCTALKELPLIKNTVSFGANAFDGCTALESVALSSRLTEIPESCFRKCTALTQDMVIPKSVTKIGSYAFYQTGCSSFTFTNAGVEMGKTVYGVGDNRIIYGPQDGYAALLSTDYGWKYCVINENKGDVNFDGKVNVADVTAIQRSLANYEALCPQAFVNANVDGNTKVNISDATRIQQFLAEYINSINESGT